MRLKLRCALGSECTQNKNHIVQTGRIMWQLATCISNTLTQQTFIGCPVFARNCVIDKAMNNK